LKQKLSYTVEMQVCQQWASWDQPALWRGLLDGERSQGAVQGAGPGEEVAAGCPLKQETRRLWRLRAAWRRPTCGKVAMEVGRREARRPSSDGEQRAECAAVTPRHRAGRTQQVVLVNLFPPRTYSGCVEEWSEGGARLRSKEMHDKGVRVVREEAAGGRLLTGSYDGRVRVWSSAWAEEASLPLGVAVTDLLPCGPGGLAMCGDEGRVEWWREGAGGWERGWAVQGGDMVNCLAACGDSLATGGDGGQLLIRWCCGEGPASRPAGAWRRGQRRPPSPATRPAAASPASPPPPSASGPPPLTARCPLSSPPHHPRSGCGAGRGPNGPAAPS
jgi:hypothetical protein